MKVLVSVKYFIIFCIVKLSKIARTMLIEWENVYQIDQNGQNEPKLIKIASTKLAKIRQNEHI